MRGRDGLQRLAPLGRAGGDVVAVQGIGGLGLSVCSTRDQWIQDHCLGRDNPKPLALKQGGPYINPDAAAVEELQSWGAHA